nr:dimethylamine monooxygenase subunit DmmA family protein [Gluconacetobacter tumulisoli]
MNASSLLPVGPLRFDEGGRRHLFVRQAPQLSVPSGPVPTAMTTWTVGGDSRVLPDPSEHEQFFRSAAHLLDRLAWRLATERVGLRLYAAGDDTFLSAVALTGDAAGMTGEEMYLAPPVQGGRRVICIHCSTMHDDVADEGLSCAGCGAVLSVRSHYSRRIGAYMGVAESAPPVGTEETGR